MRRRQVLSSLALSTASLAGCNSLGTPKRTPADVTPANVPTATDSPTETATPPVTPDPDDPILVVVRNRSDGSRRVSLTLSRSDGSTLLNESVQLNAGARTEFETGIETRGQYDLAVSIDGTERQFDVLIETYDIRMGSNQEIEITADEIRFFAEE
ncbi:hypothetical protein KTS45_05180 [Halomicroarcula limicola]|uniref:Ig-like domain-containing protein n=1 Tax=Haloarcula limicola TaxID=1429915 RepID=A0A8J7YBR9_9EURY|nr:hypothetical protein [Halomicroarcula limicola]MBV0923588.1 hypothetical protein [Halomicroarcula limicola]